MAPTFDEFVASLIANGESSGWSSQNKRTGAYGKFQITPENWRNWGPKALNWQVKGRDPLSAVAAQDIPVVNWKPRITRANQIAIARDRLMESWLKHNGDARYVAAMWEGGGTGGGGPDVWTVRQRKYVNRVCVPLGYAPLPEV